MTSLRIGLLVMAAIGCASAPPPRKAWLVEDRPAAIIDTAEASVVLQHAGLAVFDGPGDRVFLQGVDGHVEARSASSGELVFRCDTRGRPIALLASRAIAVIDDAGRFVLVDRDGGAALFVSDPTGVHAGGIVGVAYVGPGKLRIDSGLAIRGEKACCNGGDYGLVAEDIVDLATGEVTSTRVTLEGWVPRPSASALPPGVGVEIVEGPATPDSDGSVTIDRTLVVSAASGTPWQHPIEPLRFPAPSREAPRP